jgi:hypothetical protein
MSDNHLDCYLNNLVRIHLPLKKGSGVYAFDVSVKSLTREKKVIEIFFNFHPLVPNDHKYSRAFWSECEEAWFYQYHCLESATVRCLYIELLEGGCIIEWLMFQAHQQELNI